MQTYVHKKNKKKKKEFMLHHINPMKVKTKLMQKVICLQKFINVSVVKASLLPDIIVNMV